MFIDLKALSATLLMSAAVTGPGFAAEAKAKPASDTEEVYISFSGGGYHAHAGASAVMMSLMDRVGDANHTMAHVTRNVGALSSNSGGSWFLSQAAYTTHFRTALEATDGWKNYTAPDGYFGQAYSYISTLDWDDDICFALKKFLPKEYDRCHTAFENADSYLKFLVSGGDANWHELAVNAVFGAKFKDPQWQTMANEAKQPLTATRQDWAKDKSLIFASALLSDAPALNHTLDWTTIRSLKASQNGAVVPGATPVMFAVTGSSSDKAPAFLLGGDTTLQYGNALSVDGLFIPDKKIAPVTLPANTSTGPARIIDVAASSSAAGAGFIDLPDMLASDLPAVVAALLANFAPPFTLRDGTLYNGPYGYQNLKDLADKGAARLADGGFVDNTSVAYMVRYLAENQKLTENFNILAMDNFPMQPVMVGDPAVQLPTGPDVAALFGFPDPEATKRSSKLFGVFSYEGIVPQVFESGAYFKGTGKDATPTKGPDWCAWIEPKGSKADNCVVLKVANPEPADPPCDMYLSYTHYKVTVKENAYFGIGLNSGIKGNLHVFSNLGSNPGVVPDSDFQARCYAKLMDGVHQAVTGDNTFGNTLASLLGL